MYDRSRLTRLISIALASCAVTWALAGSALARPDFVPTRDASSAPAYDPTVADNDKGTINAPPAYDGTVADTNKVPDRASVDANLARLDHGGKTPAPVVATGNDATDTIALALSIVAILTAIGAVTFIVVRPQRPMLGA